MAKKKSKKLDQVSETPLVDDSALVAENLLSDGELSAFENKDAQAVAVEDEQQLETTDLSLELREDLTASIEQDLEIVKLEMSDETQEWQSLAIAHDSELAENLVGETVEVVGEATPVPGAADFSEEELVKEMMAREESEAALNVDEVMAGSAPGLDEGANAVINAGAEEIKEFVEEDQLVSILESLLFSTDKPVSLATMKVLFKGTTIRTKDIMRALDELASVYANPKRGVTLEEIHGGYQLRTKVDNSEFLRRLAKVRPFKLSGPALEVLSIVAYKQPIVKSEIDQIRGVESGHLLRALMERRLVAFAGKSELPGKPMYYGTARRFLETFGLRNLKELPSLAEIDELLPEGIGEVEEKKIGLSDITAELSEAIGTEYSDGQDELLKITDQLTAIDVSSEFFEQEKIRQREARDFERAQNIREALAVGEPVEDKDQKWLQRYEIKLKEAELARINQEMAAAARAEGAEVSSEIATTVAPNADSSENSMDQLASGDEAVDDVEFAAATDESYESEMIEMLEEEEKSLEEI